MASPRQAGQRVFASPSRRTGRARYYYDTAAGAFYSVPSRRIPQRHKLDVRDLLEIAETRRDFRITKTGDVRFRGVSIDYNVNARTIPQRLRTRRKGGGIPPEIAQYFEAVSERNPSYLLAQITTDVDEGLTYYTAIFRSPLRGTAFAVTTS